MNEQLDLPFAADKPASPAAPAAPEVPRVLQAAVAQSTTITLSQLHRVKFEAVLATKTSWGRNQLLSMFDQTLAEASLELVTVLLRSPA